MGTDPRWARELVAAGMERVVVNDVKDLRSVESRRLDDIWETIYDRAMTYGDLKAVDRLLKISHARRRLLGLDTRVELETNKQDAAPEQSSADFDRDFLAHMERIAASLEPSRTEFVARFHAAIEAARENNVGALVELLSTESSVRSNDYLLRADEAKELASLIASLAKLDRKREVSGT